MLDDRSYMRPSSFSRHRPAAVVLIIANLVAFVLQMALDRYSSIPVDRYFALSLEGLRSGFFWQLFTFQFMHGGLLHILLNCWIIYVFGRELEETLGRKAFWILYFFSGVVGGMLQMFAGLLMGQFFAGPVVGASAGAFGLVAAFAIISPERPLTLLLFFIIPFTIRAKYLLMVFGIIAALGILFPSDNIAHAAHLGGMLAGMLFVRMGGQWDWRWPDFKFPFTKARPPRPSIKMRVEKGGQWNRTNTIDLEDLPADEFLSREVDPILDKISAHGIQSLTERERRILEKARNKVA